ncbi:MAG: SulP family inorganic anion transporter [Candidatus Moranbacteria bacterium]|nr:SulP family inorganic anion transporter [Candidatus Moranbacteria bacterium]
MVFLPSRAFCVEKIKQNWSSALTVALISIPLSIALSIASGAGPLPGLITGIWGTLIGSIFIGSNYNIIGAAGALTTILFGATLTAPLGLGVAVLPLLAITSGFIILIIWILKINKYLYYIPSSVMYGFAGGVAVLIATSQIFDASGLSTLSRTGSFIGDIHQVILHHSDIHLPSLIVFGFFFGGILLWKKRNKKIPAVIPAVIIGILFGYGESKFFSSLDIISLYDKFGEIVVSVYLPLEGARLIEALSQGDFLHWLFTLSGIIALISVLETLITAKLGDKITKTESSSSKELFGLALANIGSGFMGGLPATGVFIRTGANIKAGANHRTSGILASIFTGGITLVVLPFFSYLPMAVIAAVLVHTAIGLLEVEKFKDFWRHERTSFVIAILVALITIFHDAGLGVAVGAVASLFIFAERVSHGRFDIIWNYGDNTLYETRGNLYLRIPSPLPEVRVVTYSIAGNFSYIDAVRHAEHIKDLIHHPEVPALIIRLRDLFSIDYEGVAVLDELITECEHFNTLIIVTSVAPHIAKELMSFPSFKTLHEKGYFTHKTRDALALLSLRGQKIN